MVIRGVYRTVAWTSVYAVSPRYHFIFLPEKGVLLANRGSDVENLAPCDGLEPEHGVCMTKKYPSCGSQRNQGCNAKAITARRWLHDASVSLLPAALRYS